MRWYMFIVLYVRDAPRIIGLYANTFLIEDCVCRPSWTFSFNKD